MKTARSSLDPGLADLLNYAHCVAEGVILNKDGAFLVSYRLHGPDNHSAGDSACDALVASVNRMACSLEDGWMLHADVLRIPSVAYPEEGAFPSPVARLIDTERRQRFEAVATHYENVQIFTFVWKFPLPIMTTARHWFVSGVDREDKKHPSLTQLLGQFEAVLERAVGLLSAHCTLTRLSSADLLGYLHTCISGEQTPLAVPPDGCFIDVVLGHHALVGGYAPTLDQRSICVLSIVGYHLDETHPGLLEALGTYPLVYRWSTRFVPLSEATAAREIKRYQRNWHNQVKGLMGILGEAVLGRASGRINRDALRMLDQTQEAEALNSSHGTRFGYWASSLVLMGEDKTVLQHAARDITRYLEQTGFSCRVEDINAVDAWLGTLPGHGSCNVRRIFLHAAHLAHVLPLRSLWAGAPRSASASLLPQGSPPVLYAATVGKTPFRFHLDVEDVGHQVVLGPTGSGKSTYLGLLIAQFLRYKDAQIFVFDKDSSHQALTVALGGQHYAIGQSTALSFCPLADLSTDTKKARAAQFIEECVLLQGTAITPELRNAIHTALVALSQEAYSASRSLTVFSCQVQSALVRSALRYYTLEGQVPLLDGTQDTLGQGYLHTFEMHRLLAQTPAAYIPVLRTLFDRIEGRLEDSDAARPTLIILEEAWLYMAHPVFARTLVDWLKTLRKKNARVVFATQSLADIYDPGSKTLTALTAAIMESCPTKVYLPHPGMDNEIYTLYQKIGLSKEQIDTIAHASVPKKDYYVVTPEGSRLIDLGLSDPRSIALAFLGLSKEKSKRLLACKNTSGETWLADWLTAEGLPAWAEHIDLREEKEQTDARF